MGHQGHQTSRRWVFFFVSLLAWTAATADAAEPMMESSEPAVTAAPVMPAPVMPAPATPPAAPVPSWMSPEVLKAAIEIGLDEQQQPEFRRIVGEYLTDLGKMVQTEMRRESVNKDHTIKRKSNALTKKMDEKMKAVLTEAQWPRYEAYKDVLRARMAQGSAGA